MLNDDRLQRDSDRVWSESILPELEAYIRIPNRSPAFDADWEANGHMDRAVALVEAWCRRQSVPGLTVEILRLEGRTPLLYMEAPGCGEGCVLIYGHLDKQPEMEGWREGLGPWEPVLEGDRLYGRGGADDGYAAFATLTALAALAEQGVDHARCCILIEACEESGSTDLPAYVEHLQKRIGEPDLVICLDSGCGNYDQLWCTTSLRGMASGVLRVRVLDEGVHSGDASGIVPSSFRIARNLLDRIEDSRTGELLLEEAHVPIPQDRLEQAQRSADVLGHAYAERFPLRPDAEAMVSDTTEAILNRTWRPFLAVTGAGGLPPLEAAGNVLRPETALKLSLRLPPTCDARRATSALSELLESDPPYGADVSFEAEPGMDGWNAPALAPWLEEALDAASRSHFGGDAMYMGEGGSIPFMGMLGERFPKAQFLITGVLGPQSNAHGPNEFLHLPTARRLTCVVASVLARHLEQWRATQSSS